MKNFKMVVDCLKASKIKKRVALICGVDSHSQEAISAAIREGFIEVIMVGPKSEVESYPIFSEFPDSVQFIDISDADQAAKQAVELIHQGKADILMKGIINTDNLLRVVLNKHTGLLPSGRVLTHLSLAEIPTYEHLLFFMDAAVIPYPTLEQRRAMLGYMVNTCHKFGLEVPRVALIHFTEKVDSKFPYSLECEQLVQESKTGAFGKVVLDGPLDLFTACSSEAAAIKGIESPLNGQADALLFASIESANVFYKSVTLFGQAEMAGLLMGTDCPIIITSRSDSAQTKYNSIALACLTH